MEELITCPLDGTIVPGVMRDSVIKQAKTWGINVVEKHFTITQFTDAITDNWVIEAFGTGTACVVCPFSQIKYKDQVYKLS